MDMATAQQRTMKDFLELYNRLVYHCFDKCVSNFNHAKTSPEELSCVTACTDKCITFNQRHMMVFVQHQNAKQKMATQAAADSQVAMEAGAEQAKRAFSEVATPATHTDAATEQPTSPPQEPGSGGENGSPKNVCWKWNTPNPIKPQLAWMQSGYLSTYAGKSLVEQFLSHSHDDELKFV